MKNKDKYYDELLNQWVGENYCKFAERYVLGKSCTDISCRECRLRAKAWLEEEYSPLDDKEREYLSAVIKPWRNDVKYVHKESSYMYPNFERIWITHKSLGGALHICLPYFQKGTMYKGMELNKEYSLEDLGI